MPTERTPNLFIVGAQKSGTTSLALMLASHPQIFMSTPKEPGWLAFGERGYWPRDGYGRHCRARSWVPRTENGYRELFRDAVPGCRWLGEASTWYLAEPGMPERIRDYSPDARIIAILRQPAERAYSAFSHARRDEEEPHADFESALAEEADRGSCSHLLRYREMGRYLEPLTEYLSVFGRDRVLVILHEDLRYEPHAVWRRCCSFLHVDAGATAPIADRHNRAGMPRSRLLHALLRSQRFKNIVRPFMPLRLASRAKQAAEAANLKPPEPIDPVVRARLTAEFADEIRALARLIDRDLTHWL
jgi:hypothetical protein